MKHPGPTSDNHLEMNKQFLIKFIAFSITILIAGCGGRIIVVKDPLSPAQHNDLAVAYERDGDLPLALYHYEKAVEGNPDNALFHFNLGNVLYRLGRKKEALSHYEKSFDLLPEFADALNNLCQVRLELSLPLVSCYEMLDRFIDNSSEPPWQILSTAGDVSSALGYHAKSLTYYKKALSSCRDCSDEIKNSLNEKIIEEKTVLKKNSEKGE